MEFSPIGATIKKIVLDLYLKQQNNYGPYYALKSRMITALAYIPIGNLNDVTFTISNASAVV